MSPLTLRHKLPSHVFASHHLRLAFAPLRACSALPCSCLEPSALGVRLALFSSRPIKPRFSVAHASASLRHRLSVGISRNMPSGTPLMLRSLRHLPPLPHDCPAPGTQNKKREHKNKQRKTHQKEKEVSWSSREVNYSSRPANLLLELTGNN